MSDFCIEFDGVSKEYVVNKGLLRLAQKVLDDVSFSVRRGEVYGFIGQNGAGKSTSIKALMGLISINSGKILLNGKLATEPNARKGVAYVPENASLYDYLTPLEVLKLGLAMHQVNVDHPDKYCMTWLEQFELANVAHKPIKSFSKGMAQRTALAHALAVKPSLLILDEPLSGLDPAGRRLVVDLLGQFSRDGGAIFFSSHVLFDVERLAQRFAIIHKGKMVAVKTLQELQEENGGYFLIRADFPSVVPEGWIPESRTIYRYIAQQNQIAEQIASISTNGATLIEIRSAVSVEDYVLGIDRALS